MSDEQKFEYAGGEFENDAPYSEPQPTESGNLSMDAILAQLVGEANDSEIDQCFSINTAASFAALSQPEEQLAELTLKSLKADDLLNVVDVITPVELMQFILFLQHCSVHPSLSTTTLQTIPTFYAPKAEWPDLYSWFQLNQKLLMQIGSLLGISLNHESDSTESTDSSSSTSNPSVASPSFIYSLFYHGQKVSKPTIILDILHDLFALLAIPDVIDLDSLTRQLIKEMGVFECDKRLHSEQYGPEQSAQLLSLRDKFLSLQPTQLYSSPVSVFQVQLTDKVKLVLASEASLIDQAQAVSQTKTVGELYNQMFINRFCMCQYPLVQTIEAVLQEAEPEIVTSNRNHWLDQFFLAPTARSTFASLLSPDSEQATQPGVFFREFIQATTRR